MFLNNYIYYFYPKGIRDGFSEQYLNSEQYKRLIDAIGYAKTLWQADKLKEDLKSISIEQHEGNSNFLDVTNFSFNDRAFNFQYRFENANKIVRTVCCNISVLMPAACVYFVERDFSDIQMGKKANETIFDYDLEHFPSIFDHLRQKIIDVLRLRGLIVLDNQELNMVVPEIAFEHIHYNKMTLFNCLFLNEPYIAPYEIN